VAHRRYVWTSCISHSSPDPNADQLKAYVAPTASTLAAFQSFAKANGLSVSALSDTNEWLEFTTTVGQANSLFGASYQSYLHLATGSSLTRTLAYSLPKELVGHVDTVTPATGFEIDSRFVSDFQPLKRATKTPASCNTLAPNSSITPTCLQVNAGPFSSS
jgi:tripeptidyl-peptidase I